MNRAEKAEMMKRFKAEQADTEQVVASAQTVRPVEKKKVRTFELDGEQIRYEAEQDETGTALGPINLAISRRKRELED